MFFFYLTPIIIPLFPFTFPTLNLDHSKSFFWVSSVQAAPQVRSASHCVSSPARSAGKPEKPD